MTELEEIKGVGPSIAESLKQTGITSAEDLSVRDPEEIKVILKCSLAKAKKIITAAKDATVNAVHIYTGEDLNEERKSKIQRISTNSSLFDKILGGGVPTDALTGFAGQFATGKTQLAKQLVVNMKKQHNRKSVWIETEPQTCVLDRIKQIANANGVNFDLKNDIYVIPAKFIKTPVHLFKAYEMVEKLITEKKEDIGLIVIDSFNAPFRAAYAGRETLPKRSAESGRHIGYLQQLASQHNIAIVMTLQVMGIPDSGQQLASIKRYGIRDAPVAPHVVKHGVNYLVSLEQVSANDKTWRAVIADGPVPRDECTFIIDETGIRDFTKRRGV